MARSSNPEHARRINLTLALLKQKMSLAKVVEALTDKYDISKRQAYRYIREASTLGEQISVPDAKIAFTVKLSKRLIQEIREHAKATGRSLSEIVAQALETFLNKNRGNG